MFMYCLTEVIGVIIKKKNHDKIKMSSYMTTMGRPNKHREYE